MSITTFPVSPLSRVPFIFHYLSFDSKNPVPTGYSGRLSVPPNKFSWGRGLYRVPVGATGPLQAFLPHGRHRQGAWRGNTSLLSDVLESSKRPQKVGAKREVRRTCLGPFFMSHQQAVPWVYAGWLADGTGPHSTRESEWCGMRAAFHRKGTDHGRSDCHNRLSLGGSLRV